MSQPASRAGLRFQHKSPVVRATKSAGPPDPRSADGPALQVQSLLLGLPVSDPAPREPEGELDELHKRNVEAAGGGNVAPANVGQGRHAEPAAEACKVVGLQNGIVSQAALI